MKIFFRAAAFAVLCLLFCSCAGKVEETGVPAGAEASGALWTEPIFHSLPGGQEDGVAAAALFRGADGGVVFPGTVLLSAEEEGRYALDENGSVRVSGLPREGEVRVRLLDAEGRELGCADVFFSVGEVIDASADGEGNGYVTVRADTPLVELAFTAEDGLLLCALCPAG